MEKLAKVLAKLDDASEIENLLRELLTQKEFKDLSLRWQLLIELNQGKSQRSIAQRHGISLCKITRGSKILKKQESATVKLLQLFYGGENRR